MAQHALTRFEDDALAHLFRVTASLESMVVGEAQIQGQVNDRARVWRGDLPAVLTGHPPTRRTTFVSCVFSNQ